jgi:hypothetical protein
MDGVVECPQITSMDLDDLRGIVIFDPLLKIVDAAQHHAPLGCKDT